MTDEQPTTPTHEFLPGAQQIEYFQKPEKDTWKLIPIYRDLATGSVEVWQIGYSPESQEIITSFGLVNGKKQERKRNIEVNFSGRTLQEQALLEARQRYKKKYYKGYHPETSLCEFIISPMLANDYWPGGYSEKDKKTKLPNIRRFPVACMPKLDGFRSLIYKKGNIICMRSRENRDQVPTEEHFKELRNQLLNFFMYLPEGCILDGELYHHDISFNLLSSVIHTKKFVHPLLKDMKYYIFDLIEPSRLIFNQRYDILIRSYRQYLEDFGTTDGSSSFLIIPNTLAQSHEEISRFHDYYVSHGYEGLIIRKLAHEDSPEQEKEESRYKPTRTNNLLKFKHFIDEEGEIENVVEGKGSDRGLAIFQIRDCRGNLLNVRPRGREDERQHWFQFQNEVIGKIYTFRYFQLTEDNKPRFPTGKGFRK